MPFLLYFIFLFGAEALANPDPKFFLVVIDGVRDLEIKGTATDDFGKVVSTESLFPHLSALKKEGLFLQ